MNGVRYINTGKVRIGCAYLPPSPAPSADAERLQSALLAKSDKAKFADAVVGWTLAVGFAAAVLAAMFT